MKLPQPQTTSEMSVEQAIAQRRSIRVYRRDKLLLKDVAQLLWAAQGETHQEGFRTAPSAGALYPLELYLIAGEVDGLSPGIYQYRPTGHELSQMKTDDVRKQLASAALDQPYVRNAPAVLVIAAVYQRTMKKYGQRGQRYAHIEVGHAAQNIYLQAETLGLGTVMVGAFDDEQVQSLLDLPGDHQLLALMPVGYK